MCDTWFFFSVLFFYFFFRFKWRSLYVTKAALEFTLYPRLASNLWSPPASAYEVMQELPAKVPSGREYKLEPWLYSGLLSHTHLSARRWVCCSGCAVFSSWRDLCVPCCCPDTATTERGLLSYILPQGCPWQSPNALPRCHFGDFF